jgi:hypothetical protein
LLPPFKLAGLDEFDDVEATLGWLEILADGEPVTANVTQISEHLLDLGVGFAKTEHNGRFGPDRAIALLGEFEKVKRLLIIAAGAGPGI